AMTPVPFTVKNLQSMATAIIEAFGERRIELGDDPALLADLRSLRVVEKSFGYRLDAARNAAGHADRAVALAIALHTAKELPVAADWIARCDMMDAMLSGEHQAAIPSLRELLGAETYDRYVDEDTSFPPPTGGRLRFGAGW
ncbi:MAG: hypothetical protein JNM18_16790, partial [Planctomycetaceae bacterium]|nr:hypothetical protein [Planctomycetaceae bacterium]